MAALRNRQRQGRHDLVIGIPAGDLDQWQRQLTPMTDTRPRPKSAVAA
jgi:hypothetical protein